MAGRTTGKAAGLMSACTCGKRTYLTRAEARAAVKAMKGEGRTRKQGAGRMSVYPCPTLVDRYHLGHRRPGKGTS